MPRTATGNAGMRNRRPPPGRHPADDEPKVVHGGRITDLAPQARDPERVSIFLDGAFAFGLPREVALREGLAIGDELDPERVSALLAMDEVARATSAALAFLAHRPRSEREVRDRLRQKGYAPAAIDEAVAKLEGWHYLDDAEFARFWVENRGANQPRGHRLLEQELRRKGVEREIVRETIAAADLDESGTAVELARTKLRSYAGQEPAVVRRRLGGYLARRGYDYEVVRAALDRVLGETDDASDDGA